MLAKVWQRLVRFGFRLLYNELAWSYDLVSWLVSGGDWRAWQRVGLPFLSGRRVLEIAHGPGHMLLALQEAGFQVVGLDLSPYMGRLAQRRLRRQGREAPLVRARVQQLPLADASFDGVLSTFPTDFIIEPAVLSAIFRVLRPGGRLVIVPEGHLLGRGPLARFLAWLYEITGQRWPDPAGNDEPALAHTVAYQLMRRRMEAAGFTVQLHEIRLPRSAASVVVGERTLTAGERVRQINRGTVK